MTTTAEQCLNALREAAERLGESPSKRQYEELGLQPASATIIRTVGGWNAAKEQAGLETSPSTGSRVGGKPDDVDVGRPAVALPEQRTQHATDARPARATPSVGQRA